MQSNFKRIVKNAFDADLLTVDFSDKERIKDEINRWIERETHNRLKDVLNEIDEGTVMLLINVIYFKAKWEKPFDKEYNLCRKEKFTNWNGQKRAVEMLCKTDDYMYGEFERYKILQLDYKGDQPKINAAMYVVLPHENVNLDDLVRGLNARELNNHLQQLNSQEVHLKLPKFKVKSDIDLQSVLEQLGVKTMFSGKADFSKMSSDPLMVSRALQNAYISVNENGTEAAAATILEFGLGASQMDPPKPVEFYADRPFMFIIRLNGANIFAGLLKEL